MQQEVMYTGTMKTSGITTRNKYINKQEYRTGTIVTKTPIIAIIF